MGFMDLQRQAKRFFIMKEKEGAVLAVCDLQCKMVSGIRSIIRLEGKLSNRQV